MSSPALKIEPAPKALEPSMEEILASIRRIIADDDSRPAPKPAPPSPPAAEPEPSAGQEDIDVHEAATRSHVRAVVVDGRVGYTGGFGLADYARSGELVDLLVGSEGTLAFIVGVELDLTEVPGATASLLASYASLDGAVIGADEARRGGASACELLDRTFLDVAARGSPLPIPVGTEAVLLIELEADNAHDSEAVARALASILEQHGATSVAIGCSSVKQRDSS